MAVLVAVAIATGACSSGSEPAQPVQDPNAGRQTTDPTVAQADTAGAPTQPGPTPPRFSNVVPSVDELLEIGLSRDEAECFIARLDPARSGVFTDADRFSVAMGDCFDG